MDRLTFIEEETKRLLPGVMADPDIVNSGSAVAYAWESAEALYEKINREREREEALRLGRDMRPLAIQRLREDAYEYRIEPFKLKSGGTSNHYVNCRSLLLSEPRVFGEAVYQLAADLEYDFVAGVAMGGLPIAHAVADASERRGMYRPPIYVRPEAKDHGKGGQLVLPLHADDDMRVLLVEDVVTTGSSSVAALGALREHFEVVAVVALVDREEGGAQVFRDFGVPFRAITTLKELATQ